MIRDVKCIYGLTRGSDVKNIISDNYHITGFHLYSYSLDFMCLDPLGSTNFGKLTNISLRLTASFDANQSGVAGTAAQSGMAGPNLYLFVASAVNNNIIRISGGALGFPVL